MDKILISACLMGDPVRYDGGAKPVRNAHLTRWQKAGRLLVVCPEAIGGFPTPRLPAEIEPNARAEDVLQRVARLVDSQGSDVTAGFLEGAQATLELAQKAGCRHAILKEGSPSCATGFVYSGRFDGIRKSGLGVTTAMLLLHGIQVWSEQQIDQMAKSLAQR